MNRLVFCVNINILVVTLHNSFPRYQHWEEIGKVYKGSLYYFLELHVNAQLF